MFNVGGAEVLVIALVALVVVGPEQLPSILRKAGRYASQIRNMSVGLRDEFMSGVDELNPKNWDNEESARGTGEAAKPIVPKGYAERVAAGEPGNPFNPKPVTQQMAEPSPDEAAAEAEAEAERAEEAARVASAKAARLRQQARDKANAAAATRSDDDHDDAADGGAPSAPVNQIAAANSSAALAKEATEAAPPPDGDPTDESGDAADAPMGDDDQPVDAP